MAQQQTPTIRQMPPKSNVHNTQTHATRNPNLLNMTEHNALCTHTFPKNTGVTVNCPTCKKRVVSVRVWQTPQQMKALIAAYREYYDISDSVWVAFEKSVKDYYKMLKDTGAFLSCNRIVVTFGDWNAVKGHYKNMLTIVPQLAPFCAELGEMHDGEMRLIYPTEEILNECGSAKHVPEEFAAPMRMQAKLWLEFIESIFQHVDETTYRPFVTYSTVVLECGKFYSNVKALPTMTRRLSYYVEKYHLGQAPDAVELKSMSDSEDSKSDLERTAAENKLEWLIETVSKSGAALHFLYDAITYAGHMARALDIMDGQIAGIPEGWGGQHVTENPVQRAARKEQLKKNRSKHKTAKKTQSKKKPRRRRMKRWPTEIKKSEYQYLKKHFRSKAKCLPMHVCLRQLRSVMKEVVSSKSDPLGYIFSLSVDQMNNLCGELSKKLSTLLVMLFRIWSKEEHETFNLDLESDEKMNRGHADNLHDGLPLLATIQSCYKSRMAGEKNFRTIDQGDCYLNFTKEQYTQSHNYGIVENVVNLRMITGIFVTSVALNALPELLDEGKTFTEFPDVDEGGPLMRIDKKVHDEVALRASYLGDSLQAALNAMQYYRPILPDNAAIFDAKKRLSSNMQKGNRRKEALRLTRQQAGQMRWNHQIVHKVLKGQHEPISKAQLLQLLMRGYGNKRSWNKDMVNQSLRNLEKKHCIKIDNDMVSVIVQSNK